jgi:hypothetical protein
MELFSELELITITIGDSELLLDELIELFVDEEELITVLRLELELELEATASEEDELLLFAI